MSKSVSSQPYTTIDRLIHEGIAQLDPIYSPQELAHIHDIVTPFLAARADMPRSYVHPDELVTLGLWDSIFSPAMRAALFGIMPDPVLYHCHIYEIAAHSQTSHIFGDVMEGWHCDTDSEYYPKELTHVSLFVYLTDVGDGDGAFEFIPGKPNRILKHATAYVSVQGKAGTSFMWNRPFYHRASPNTGPTRRRLLKLSIQRNRFISTHISNAHFQTVRKHISAGNTEMDLLLGRYQGKPSPTAIACAPLPLSTLRTTHTLTMSNAQLFKTQAIKKLQRYAKCIRQLLLGAPTATPAAYE
jgi:hypothetical protein